MQNAEHSTSNGNGTRPLTPKAELFASEFLVDMNGTQAAIRAGYSPKRADQMAYELLRKPEIINSINKRRNELRERLEITQEAIVQGLYEIATDVKQPGSSRVPAYMGIAKILGFIVDKRDITGSIEHVLPQRSNMTIEELREAVATLKALEAKAIEGEYRELPIGDAADSQYNNCLNTGPVSNSDGREIKTDNTFFLE